MIVKEIETKNVLTQSNLPVSDYSVNPYVGCAHACKYCYASFMKRFTGHSEPWGAFVDVKHWPPILRPERYAGKELFIGSVTDPYQPLEETCKRTRALLEQLQGNGCKISIATKSDLVLRDLDLIKTFPDARVSWSINTLDEDFRKEMDEAVSIERRLAAMESLSRRRGAYDLLHLADLPRHHRPARHHPPAKAHCNLIWLENLNLRGSYKAVILGYIRESTPTLLALYQAIYQRNDRRLLGPVGCTAAGNSPGRRASLRPERRLHAPRLFRAARRGQLFFP